VIDVHGLVAAELELSIDLRAAERLRLLLRDADEDDLVAHVALPAERLRLHRFAELLRHLPQHYRGWNRLAQLHPHEW
jgi:hypothetical protein